MKITIYELLGLVKDGKAPKEIKYSGIEYEFNGNEYINEFGVNLLQHLTYAEYIMTHKVEIIEEEKKIPEKIKIEEKSITVKGTTFFREKDIEIFQKLSMEINEIINYLEYIKSKGDEPSTVNKNTQEFIKK